MLVLTASQTRASLDLKMLIGALKRMFIEGCTVPLRHHHNFPITGEVDGTILLMPAWQENRFLGVKLVNVVPGNAQRGTPALSSTYMLCDAKSGVQLALIDGNEITSRRTVAASALAASFLARSEASRLLVVGAGRVARLLPAAHACVRPIREVAVWDINSALANEFVNLLNDQGYNAKAAIDLETAVASADIVSCATLSTTPLIHGEWLRPGTHLDLIGSFTPSMREVSDSTITRCSLFVDTEAALDESGDLAQPIGSGLISPQDVKANLSDLCKKAHLGRSDDDEITLFKSVGTALEDLAAASLVYSRSQGHVH